MTSCYYGYVTTKDLSLLKSAQKDFDNLLIILKISLIYENYMKALKAIKKWRKQIYIIIDS